MALFVLFAVQFPFPQTSVRLGFSALYLVIALVLLVRRRADLVALVRAGSPKTGAMKSGSR